MSFTDLQNFSNPPERVCGSPVGSILRAFPPKPLDPHSRLGYSFRSEPCNDVETYDADVCVTGDTKMTPDEYGDEKDAELRVIQAAFKCSTIGATDEELREHARGPIQRNLWRQVDATLEGILDLEDVPSGGPFDPACALAEAAQFLAVNSFCGTGVIYGNTNWFSRLGNHNLVKDGDFYRDMLGNIVIPNSLADDTVYAFDSSVEVRISEILLLDEYAPGIRTVNDKIVRAELVYTVAVDNCATASFSVEPCA